MFRKLSLVLVVAETLATTVAAASAAVSATVTTTVTTTVIAAAIIATTVSTAIASTATAAAATAAVTTTVTASAAAVSAAITTASTVSATVTTTAEAGAITFGTRTGLVHDQVTAVKAFAVGAFDGSTTGFVIGHFNESEATATVRYLVHDDFGRSDLSERSEKLLEILVLY